jgi:hypothetical protein
VSIRRFACGHIAKLLVDAIVHNVRPDDGLMLASKPYREPELAQRTVRLVLGEPPPKTLNRAYPPRRYINRSSDAAATRKRSSALLRLMTSVWVGPRLS